jgi:hypothetical protein
MGDALVTGDGRGRAGAGRASESLKPGSIVQLPTRYAHSSLAAAEVTLAGERAWPVPQSAGRCLPYAPRSALPTQIVKSVRIPHCRRPLSAHVSRIAVNSIPHYSIAALSCWSPPSSPFHHAVRECDRPPPTALTCRPYWACLSKSTRRINRPKVPTWSCFVAPLDQLSTLWRPPLAPDWRLSRPRLAFHLRAPVVLKSVMLSRQHAKTVTLRKNNIAQRNARSQALNTPQARRCKEVLADLAQHVY